MRPRQTRSLRCSRAFPFPSPRRDAWRLIQAPGTRDSLGPTSAGRTLGSGRGREEEAQRWTPLALLLLVALQPSLCLPIPPSSSPTSFLGFIALPPGTDYPDYDLEYLPSVSLAQCLQTCLSFPAGECVMVVTSPAGECWLKSHAGPTAAANSKASAYALPCNVNSTCGDRLCNQTVTPGGVSFECVPPEAVSFQPTSPFNAWFQGFDTTWGGTSLAKDSAECVAACVTPGTTCVVALYNLATRQCSLKYAYVPSTATASLQFQGFVNSCADNNGGCGTGLACSSGPPKQCVNVSAFGFSALKADVDFQGADIISYPSMDPATCVQLCSKEPSCLIAQADPATLHCQLKSADGIQTTAIGYVAFERVPGY